MALSEVPKPEPKPSKRNQMSIATYKNFANVPFGINRIKMMDKMETKGYKIIVEEERKDAEGVDFFAATIANTDATITAYYDKEDRLQRIRIDMYNKKSQTEQSYYEVIEAITKRYGEPIPKENEEAEDLEDNKNEEEQEDEEATNSKRKINRKELRERWEIQETHNVIQVKVSKRKHIIIKYSSPDWPKVYYDNLKETTKNL